MDRRLEVRSTQMLMGQRMRSWMILSGLATALALGSTTLTQPPATLPATSPISTRHTTSTASQPGIAEWEKWYLKNPRTASLSKRLRIYAEAPTFADLVAKTKPDFTWQTSDAFGSDEPSLLWIEHNSAEEPVFRLEQAFTCGHENGKPVRWVLVRESEEKANVVDDAYRDMSGWTTPMRAELVSEKPVSDHPRDYAILKSDRDGAGRVYEVGWGGMLCFGSGNYETQRIILLFRDAQGTWSLLGELPEATSGRLGGSASAGGDISYSVHWTKGKTAPVEIHFSRSTSLSPSGEGADEEAPMLVTYHDGMLRSAHETVWEKRRYAFAEEGDTLEQTARRLAYWHRGGTDEQARWQDQAAWVNYLKKRNPMLVSSIKKGDRVYFDYRSLRPSGRPRRRPPPPPQRRL